MGNLEADAKGHISEYFCFHRKTYHDASLTTSKQKVNI